MDSKIRPSVKVKKNKSALYLYIHYIVMFLAYLILLVKGGVPENFEKGGGVENFRRLFL